MDQVMEDDDGQVGGGPAPYWPPDQAMRLECLRLAVQAKPHGNTLAEAGHYYNFVTDLVDMGTREEANILRSCAEVARVYAKKARSGGEEQAANVAEHIAGLIADRAGTAAQLFEQESGG
jgi:hypothetical protein